MNYMISWHSMVCFMTTHKHMEVSSELVKRLEWGNQYWSWSI